jgi:hypothetical protein
MTSQLLAFASGVILTCVIIVTIPGYLLDTTSTPGALTVKTHGLKRGGVVSLCLGALLPWLILKLWSRGGARKSQEAMYGLQHGRLHLQVQTPMWMNMGYWGERGSYKTLAEACRDLLKQVLAEAGFEKEIDLADKRNGTRKKKMLIDLGIGCGEQAIYLMGEGPVGPCDRGWWDEREHCIQFDHYIGITDDATQAGYASKRVEELKLSGKVAGRGGEGNPKCYISIFGADAAIPASWVDNIHASIENALADTDSTECWMLALDTAYHFYPSRWSLIKYAHKHLQASFMAFDLCLSPNATSKQKLVLRILTKLMGAPWANFGTPDDYRRRLVEAGYSQESIKLVDVSERVFAPLAQYLDQQDSRLKTLGLGIGSFSVAKSLFAWWGRSGVVRGIIVVARR